MIDEPWAKNMNVDASGDVVFLLPDEVIYSIMLKLPMKSLVRFLSLSKQWKDAVTNRKFIEHRKKMISPELLVTYILSVRSYFEEFRYELLAYPMSQGQLQRAIKLSHPNSHGNYVSLRSSSDGLLGLIFNDGVCDFGVCTFLIWNPFTGLQREFSLPDKAFATAGFGYDATIDDYKIILIFDGRVMVRAFKCDEWRTVHFSSSHRVLYSFETVSVDGDVWWTAHKASDASFGLMKFSLAEEKLSTVAWPQDANPDPPGSCRVRYQIERHDKSLYLIDYWPGKEYYNIWRIIKQGNAIAWEPARRVPLSGCSNPIGLRADGALIAEIYGHEQSYACIPSTSTSSKGLDVFKLQEGNSSKIDYWYWIFVLDNETLFSP